MLPIHHRTLAVDAHTLAENSWKFLGSSFGTSAVGILKGSQGTLANGELSFTGACCGVLSCSLAIAISSSENHSSISCEISSSDSSCAEAWGIHPIQPKTLVGADFGASCTDLFFIPVTILSEAIPTRSGMIGVFIPVDSGEGVGQAFHRT